MKIQTVEGRAHWLVTMGVRDLVIGVYDTEKQALDRAIEWLAVDSDSVVTIKHIAKIIVARHETHALHFDDDQRKRYNVNTIDKRTTR